MRVCALITLLFVTLAASAQSPSVAITVDDLICASCGPLSRSGDPESAAVLKTNRRLVSRLRDANVPVTGFVITKSVEDAGAAGRQALQLWLDAGFELGSHSYSHPNFADISLAEEEAEIARADDFLRPILNAKHRKLEFYRFPYHDAGDTQAKHDGIASYLKGRGYQVATCTIDTSDYEFAAAYLRAVTLKDLAMAERIRKAYLEYSAAEIDFYSALNKKVLGYEPPEVMLIHDSLLNADAISELLGLFRSRGYTFVSLAQAQSDPAYAIPDTYVTKYGPMWGYRWAVERQAGRTGLREPEPPSWLEEYSKRKE